MHCVTILLATLSTLIPTTTAQHSFPAPISLVNTTHAGTGCPSGTILQTFDSSLLSLQFNLTRYNASIGAGIPVSENRKNCQIHAEIQFPANYSLTVARNRVYGVARLSEGVAAQFLSTVFLSGAADQVRIFP